MLWGDDQPARPNEQIAVLVSRLRAVLGSDRVLRTDAGYSLRCDWLDVDELTARVQEAERCLRGGRPSAARAAAQAALAEDGEWVELERAASERVVARARLALAEAVLAGGDHRSRLQFFSPTTARRPASG